MPLKFTREDINWPNFPLFKSPVSRQTFISNRNVLLHLCLLSILSQIVANKLFMTIHDAKKDTQYRPTWLQTPREFQINSQCTRNRLSFGRIIYNSEVIWEPTDACFLLCRLTPFHVPAPGKDVSTLFPHLFRRHGMKAILAGKSGKLCVPDRDINFGSYLPISTSPCPTRPDQNGNTCLKTIPGV